MNTQEQNYHDYLLSLNDSMLVAMSYARIRNHNVSQFTPEEAAYSAYWSTLIPIEWEEADYRIFSSLYDLIPASLHPAYEAAFSLVGYSLAEKCKRNTPKPH